MKIRAFANNLLLTNPFHKEKAETIFCPKYQIQQCVPQHEVKTIEYFNTVNVVVKITVDSQFMQEVACSKRITNIL